MIRQADHTDLNTLAALALQLWPDHTAEELYRDFSETMSSGGVFFLALADGRPAGFAQCQLRRDYVEGTASSPVGYLEGIFVTESHRRQGVARRLLAACEEWARRQGCREFASDCELSNTLSQQFHEHLGFREANRIVCYTRQL